MNAPNEYQMQYGILNLKNNNILITKTYVFCNLSTLVLINYTYILLRISFYEK